MQWPGEDVTYFRVDDGMWGNPKILMIPLEAIGMWVKAGSYCGKYATDGFVPDGALAILGGEHADRLAADLVAGGLWEPVLGGFCFVKWSEYQLSKEEIEATKRRWRESSAAYRRRRAGDVSDDVSDDVNGDVRADVNETSGTERNGTERKSVDRTEGGFDSFWSVYPRKVGKKEAHKAFERACRDAMPTVIVAGAVRFRDDPNRLPEFTPHPTTWLNQGRWDDDPLPPRAGTGRNAVKTNELQESLRLAAERDAAREQKEIGA